MSERISESERWQLIALSERVARLDQELKIAVAERGAAMARIGTTYGLGGDDRVELATGTIERKLPPLPSPPEHGVPVQARD